MERTHINNLIKKVLNIDWEPDISDTALRILDKCGSTTEKLYLLGAAYYIEQTRDKYNGELSGSSLPIIGCKITHNNNTYEGLWFVCPWAGWLSGMGAGPTACALVPQLKFPDINYHHDFGLFYGESDGGGAPWHFKCAIEIDPEVTHSDRRGKDAYRDNIVDYHVVRIYDEIHDYLSWFKEKQRGQIFILHAFKSSVKNEDLTLKCLRRMSLSSSDSESKSQKPLEIHFSHLSIKIEQVHSTGQRKGAINSIISRQ